MALQFDVSGSSNLVCMCHKDGDDHEQQMLFEQRYSRRYLSIFKCS